MRASFPTTERKIERVAELFSEREVGATIQVLAQKIAAKYLPLIREKSRDFRLVLIGVLNGSAWLAPALAREVECLFSRAGYIGYVEWDFVSVSRYPEGAEPSEIRFLLDTKRSIAGAFAILVEDIIDTGTTASWLLALLEAKKPRQLELCALVDKTACREKKVRPDYVGLEVNRNLWLLGCGLDSGGYFRALDFIGYAVFVEEKS